MDSPSEYHGLFVLLEYWLLVLCLLNLIEALLIDPCCDNKVRNIYTTQRVAENIVFQKLRVFWLTFELAQKTYQTSESVRKTVSEIHFISIYKAEVVGET
jgi:hypothetical protein